MCSEVLECKRRVCFFAHTEDELRRPVDDTTWMQQHTGGLDADQFGASVCVHARRKGWARAPAGVITARCCVRRLQGTTDT